MTTQPKRLTAEEEARRIIENNPLPVPPGMLRSIEAAIAAALRQRDEAILAQEKSWCLALLSCDPEIIHDITKRAIETRHPLVSQIIARKAAGLEDARRSRPMPSNDPTNEQGQFIPSVLPTHPRNPMSDAKPLTPEVSARFEVDQYLFDCARPVVGHNFTDYEKHALLHRFVNLFKTIEALRARAEQAEADRKVLAEVVRRTDFAASLLSLAITHIPATNEIYKWAASGVDELRQARIDARAALARAGEVKP